MGHSGQFKKGDGRKRNPFKKGYDPRRVTYKSGDGRKRHRFPKGEVANPRLQEVNFQEGNIAASLREGPKTHTRRVELIPSDLQIEVSPDDDGLDLVEMLDVTISFACQMQELIAKSSNPNNNEAVGRYQELINKCLNTAAQIRGGKITPAGYGELDDDAVAQLKLDLAKTLSNTMTKMQHSLKYAMEKGTLEKGIFDDRGQIKTWAGPGFCHLINGARSAIEMRAKLDAWTHRGKNRSDPIIEAYRNIKR